MTETLRTLLFLPLVGALALAGCGTIPDIADDDDGEEESATVHESAEEPSTPESEPADEAAESARESGPEPPADRGFTGDNLYRLLVAEMAGQRGDLDTALEGYLEAADTTRDPRVAERAARTAVHLDRPEAAARAAGRWLELRPESRDAHTLMARLSLEQGDVDRAVGHLRAVIEHTPGGTDAGLREVAALAGRIDDPLAVNAALDRLLETHPESTALHYTVAAQASAAGNQAAALESLEEVLALEPDHVQALILRAEVLARSGREEEALAGLVEARERQPGERNLALGHVHLLIDLERGEAARRQMQRVFEAFGDDGHVVSTLALLAMRIDALDDARIYLQRQIAMEARVGEARYYLGRIAEQRGDCDEAMSQYIRVRSRDYQFDAQQRFAVCLAREDRIEEARMHLERLQQSRREAEARKQVQQTRAEIERAAGNLDEALGILSTAVDEHPQDDDLRYARAIYAAEAGVFDLAVDDLESMLERNPDSARVQNALGYTLADAGVELERARSLIEQALERQPDDAATLDSMGWVLYRQGEPEQALDYLRAAWEQVQDAEIGAHLGEVLWVLGERGEARDVWDTAAEDNPDHPVLRDTRERLEE